MQNVLYDNVSNAISGGLDVSSNTVNNISNLSSGFHDTFLIACVVFVFCVILLLLIKLMYFSKMWAMMSDISAIRKSVDKLLKKQEYLRNAQLSTSINQIQENNDSDDS